MMFLTVTRVLEMQRRERRLRLRRKENIPYGQARMNPEMMNELNISSEIEVVIAGKKKYRFIVVPLDSVPRNEVWCNAEELREHGIADNTIATIRAFRQG